MTALVDFPAVAADRSSIRQVGYVRDLSVGPLSFARLKKGTSPGDGPLGPGDIEGTYGAVGEECQATAYAAVSRLLDRPSFWRAPVLYFCPSLAMRSLSIDPDCARGDLLNVDLTGDSAQLAFALALLAAVTRKAPRRTVATGALKSHISVDIGAGIENDVQIGEIGSLDQKFSLVQREWASAGASAGLSIGKSDAADKSSKALMLMPVQPITEAERPEFDKMASSGDDPVPWLRDRVAEEWPNLTKHIQVEFCRTLREAAWHVFG